MNFAVYLLTSLLNTLPLYLASKDNNPSRLNSTEYDIFNQSFEDVWSILNIVGIQGLCHIISSDSLKFYPIVQYTIMQIRILGQSSCVNIFV